MRRVVSVLVLAGLVSGAAFGGTMEKLKAWAERYEPDVLERQLTSWGVTNAADRTELRESWDEDKVVELGLKPRGLYLLAVAIGREELSDGNMEKVRQTLLQLDPVPSHAASVIRALPVEERGQFEGVLKRSLAAQYPKNPAYARWMAYETLNGIDRNRRNASAQEMVRVILAPEGMTLQTANHFKKTLKDRAVVLAREKLRREGKSFVAKDGVNPLEQAVKPVVDALNAPLCEGIEEALRGLGCEIADVDRGELRTWAEKNQGEIMMGDVSSVHVINATVGKLAIALGPDGYNQFVDEYNNGTGGGE